VQGILKMMN
jgi:hypothetical protein